MQYEYSKIDASLNGMYAFGIQNDYIVGVKSTENIVNIVQIDPEKDYDYKYYNTKLYLLEKECGKISVIDLNELGKIDEIIELNSNIKSFFIIKLLDVTFPSISSILPFSYLSNLSSDI